MAPTQPITLAAPAGGETDAARRRRSFIATAMLFFFVAGLAMATAGEELLSASEGDLITHQEGAPCSDPDNDGHPCSPACACACCPGHFSGVAFAVAPTILAIPASKALGVHPVDELQPEGIRPRIFHPPRA